MSDLPPGVRRHGAGYEATVKYRGDRRYLSFPLAATPGEMRLAIETARAELTLLRGERPQAGTFAADADRYLRAVAKMPSIKDRRKHIAEWVVVFGRRRRSSIKSDEIRAHLETLKERYAASSINHRRTALMHLWTVLDGKGKPNPVKDVPKQTPPDEEARGLPREVQVLLLRAIKPGTSRARLHVMRWTGFPQKQIARIAREHLDVAGATVLVLRRQKGKGVKAKRLPLLPQAVRAFRYLDRLDAFGPFKVQALRITVGRARRRLLRRHAQGRLRLSPLALWWLSREAKHERIRPYDFRHSYGSLLRRHTPDLKSRQELMLHGDARQTARYELEAADAAVQDALARVAARLKAEGGAAWRPLPSKKDSG